MEAEKEELSEEIAALQQERDEGLLLAESEKQQVREPGRGVGSRGWLCGSPTSAQHTPTQQLGMQEKQSVSSWASALTVGQECWRPSTVTVTGDTRHAVLLSLPASGWMPLGCAYTHLLILPNC